MMMMSDWTGEMATERREQHPQAMEEAVPAAVEQRPTHKGTARWCLRSQAHLLADMVVAIPAVDLAVEEWSPRVPGV